MDKLEGVKRKGKKKILYHLSERRARLGSGGSSGFEDEEDNDDDDDRG
jgi:hypothetical protein